MHIIFRLPLERAWRCRLRSAKNRNYPRDSRPLMFEKLKNCTVKRPEGQCLAFIVCGCKGTTYNWNYKILNPKIFLFFEEAHLSPVRSAASRILRKCLILRERISPLGALKNAACGDCNFRVRRWSFPRAAIANSAGGVFKVGLPGLEPGKAGPESAVLPLHHSPILKLFFRNALQRYGFFTNSPNKLPKKT